MIKILLIAMMVTFALADIGKIAVVKGDATVERDVKIIKAHNNMGLLKKDTVSTKKGRMQMHFNDNTVISLGRDSRFVIKEYLYVENSEQVAATFKIEKGFIQTITGAIGKVMPELFVLETSATKITPHGTIWSVEVDDENEIYKVLEGRITLAFNDGLDRKVELNAGEAATILKTSQGVVKSFKKNKISKRNFASSQYENSLEKDGAIRNEDQSMNYGTMIDSSGELVSTPIDDGNTPVDDGNNGGGNDPGGNDPSNPGNGPQN